MKKRTKVLFGATALTAGIGAYVAKKRRTRKEAETDAVNKLGIVNVDDSFYPVAEINAQNGDLELTAEAAQQSIRNKDKLSEIIKLSVMQIKQVVPDTTVAA